MKPEQLEAIRERARVATKGPWYTASTTDGPWIIEENGNIISGTCSKVADGGFIANAREDIPALLAEVERLREALEFYAKRANNNYSLNNAPDWTELIESPVMRDGGVIAKKTLRGADNANEEIR